MKRYCLIVHILLLLLAGTAQATLKETDPLEQRCLSESGDDAMRACQGFAESNHDHPRKLLRVGSWLEDDKRYAEAIALYETGLHYHPRNVELQRRKVLARSEWRERSQAGTLHTDDKDETVAPYVRSRLNAIKCQYLTESASDPACADIKHARRPDVARKTPAPASIAVTGSTGRRNQTQPAAYSQQESAPLNHNAAFRTPTRLSYDALNLTSFHALVIGNNRYRNFTRLETAVADAKSVSSLLRERYGFKVKTLLNASRYELLKELSRLRRTLKEGDNLLIYYAGHGYLDEKTRRGYWLPVDAEEDNYANWLSTTDVTDMVNGMTSRRVLIIADSCYSGTLTRGTLKLPDPVDHEQLELIKRIADKRSRTVLTSGGLEPVLDSGRGEHSVFAEAFLDTMRENQGIIETARVFSLLRRKVILNADQTPEYADIRKAGHEGGDFIFINSGQASSR